MNLNIHVVPTVPNGWAVEVEGSAGPAELYGTQEEAIVAGAARAKAARVDLLIHGQDGQVRKRHSFSADSNEYTNE